MNQINMKAYVYLGGIVKLIPICHQGLYQRMTIFLKLNWIFFLKPELRFLFYEIDSQVLNFKVMCSFLSGNENQIYF